MSTSRTAGLSEPVGNDKISLGTLGYVRARVRQRAFELIMREFRKSGLSQADFARRLGKAPEVVSRLLSRPRNLEMDTFSDMLFAATGSIAAFEATRLGRIPVLKEKAQVSSNSSISVATLTPQYPVTNHQFTHVSHRAAA